MENGTLGTASRQWDALPSGSCTYQSCLGIRPWRIAATPTRRLSARALVAPQANWEEHVGAGEITGAPPPTSSPFSAVRAEDYALRVCAVNRGGSSPYSNVVIARPARSRAEIELDLPGPLPQSVRDVLDMEDQFRDEEKQSGSPRWSSLSSCVKCSAARCLNCRSSSVCFR